MESRKIMSLLSTLNTQPIIGIIGAVMASAVTPMDLLQTVAMVLGLAIAVVTLWIKILDLRKKLREMKFEVDDIEDVIESPDDSNGEKESD